MHGPLLFVASLRARVPPPALSLSRHTGEQRLLSIDEGEFVVDVTPGAIFLRTTARAILGPPNNSLTFVLARA